MMGARHLRGLAELERVAPGSVHLLGVCDLRAEAAALWLRSQVFRPQTW